MRKLSALQLCPILAIVILLMIWAMNKIVSNAIDASYSSMQVSSSITVSKEKGVFLSEPKVSDRKLKIDKYEVIIKDVWIEQRTRIEYKFLLFRQVIPIGTQLVLTVDVGSSETPEKISALSSGVLFRELICNNSIKITGVIPSIEPNIYLYYGEIQEPYPETISCSLKR
jgi:hypothetical protein